MDGDPQRGGTASPGPSPMAVSPEGGERGLQDSREASSHILQPLRGLPRSLKGLGQGVGSSGSKPVSNRKVPLCLLINLGWRPATCPWLFLPSFIWEELMLPLLMSLSVLMKQVPVPLHPPHQLGGGEDCSDVSSGPREDSQIHNYHGHNENDDVDSGYLRTSTYFLGWGFRCVTGDTSWTL